MKNHIQQQEQQQQWQKRRDMLPRRDRCCDSRDDDNTYRSSLIRKAASSSLLITTITMMIAASSSSSLLAHAFTATTTTTTPGWTSPVLTKSSWSSPLCSSKTTTRTSLLTDMMGRPKQRQPLISRLAAGPSNTQDETTTDQEKSITSSSSSPLDQALASGNVRKVIQALQQSNMNHDPQTPSTTAPTTTMENETGGESSSNPTAAAMPQSKLTRAQWNQIFDLIEETTANAQENDSENLRLLAAAANTEFPLTSVARQDMTDLYQTLQQQRQLRLFGALNVKDNEPLAAHRPTPPSAKQRFVPPYLLEQILDLPMKALTPQPTNSVLWAGALVAVLEGVISAALNIPMTQLFLLSLLLVILDRFVANGATLESFIKLFSPGVQQKITRHEAGHFLIAYLLGCPVEGIVLSAWAALQDKRFGAAGNSVSAGTSFFDPELSQQINTQQRVTQSSVDRYSIIVMAGIAAEADFYGRADGGAGDEMSLIAFLSQLNAGGGNQNPILLGVNGGGRMGGGGGGTPQWTMEAIQNQARWGALQAVLLLRQYQPAYEALVDALERGGTLKDCVFAIEQAARKHDLHPVQHPLGYITPKDDKNESDLRWQPYESLNSTTSTTTTTTSSSMGESTNGVTNTNGETPAVSNTTMTTTTMTKTVEENKDEDLVRTLQQYRSQVESKLKDVEQRLKEMEQQQS